MMRKPTIDWLPRGHSVSRCGAIAAGSFYNERYADDLMNGYLLLSSPLGQALSQGSPGDELNFLAGDTASIAD